MCSAAVPALDVAFACFITLPSVNASAKAFSVFALTYDLPVNFIANGDILTAVNGRLTPLYGSISSKLTPNTASCSAACLSCLSDDCLALALTAIVTTSSLSCKILSTNLVNTFLGPNSTKMRPPSA